jgi:hypothetical protein
MYSMFLKNSLTKSPIEVSVWVGINLTAFVLWHTIVKIELNCLLVLLLQDSGRPTI